MSGKIKADCNSLKADDAHPKAYNMILQACDFQKKLRPQIR